jgi:hypothetical protein
MVRRGLHWIAVTAWMMVAAASGTVSQDRVADEKTLDGIWSGAWGGGDRNGVVFQPVIAELIIQGDRVELAGFRAVNRLTGTVRVDPRTKRMRISAAVTDDDQRTPKAIEFTYTIKGDQLTLTDAENIPISFQRVDTVKNPLANSQFELVTATGMDEAGNLIVTEFSVLQAGHADRAYYQPERRARSTKEATIFLVQENGSTELTVDEARRRIREPVPVAIAYRQEDQAQAQQLHQLWKNVGAAAPDSEAVRRTLSRVLRPGTLVFILAASERIPQP